MRLFIDTLSGRMPARRQQGPILSPTNRIPMASSRYKLAFSISAVVVAAGACAIWRHEAAVTNGAAQRLPSPMMLGTAPLDAAAATTAKLRYKSRAIHAKVVVSQELSPQQIAINFGALAKRAESGDAEAAKTLYQALQSCNDAPRDEAGLQKQLKLLKGELQTTHAEDSFAVASRSVTLPYERCRWFSGEQIDTAWHWLELGAKSGDETLLSQYYWKGISRNWRGLEGLADRKEFSDTALILLQQGADQGSPDAMGALSDAYARGTLNVERDPVKAYAYLEIFMLLQENQSGFGADAATRNLDRIGQRLDSQQLRQAQQFASDLLAGCCR